MFTLVLHLSKEIAASLETGIVCYSFGSFRPLFKICIFVHVCLCIYSKYSVNFEFQNKFISGKYNRNRSHNWYDPLRLTRTH